MSYISSKKLIKDLVKQDCLKKNLFETTLTRDERAQKGTTPETVKRSVYEASLTAHCQKLGVKSYLEQMSHANLTTLYASIRTPLAEGEKDVKKNKIFLTKRITISVTHDFNGYFEDLSGEDAKIFHAMTNSKISEKIIEEITLVGLEIFLFTVQAKVLSELCTNFEYDVQSNNPTLMVTSILMGSVPPKKETQPKKKITFSKTKPKSLKKGLTYHDIFQHYYVNELSEFCRKHEMKVSGNKKDLINRILRFLNEGIKEVPKPRKSADAAEAEVEEEEEGEEGEEGDEEGDEEGEGEEEEEHQEEEEDEQDAELVEEEKEVEEAEEEKEIVPEVVNTFPTKLKKSSSSQSKIVNPSPSKAKKPTGVKA
ncbi:hypothetical protein RB653_002959 [Dictyostelium firmibasis]|uniref:SAP domain-containing protein n=1 Tax=Dictyostelium firmibasis TaxID=79012 RepID=A0AAN7TRJ0_9MYCE